MNEGFKCYWCPSCKKKGHRYEAHNAYSRLDGWFWCCVMCGWYGKEPLIEIIENVQTDLV